MDTTITYLGTHDRNSVYNRKQVLELDFPSAGHIVVEEGTTRTIKTSPSDWPLIQRLMGFIDPLENVWPPLYPGVTVTNKIPSETEEAYDWGTIFSTYDGTELSLYTQAESFVGSNVDLWRLGSCTHIAPGSSFLTYEGEMYILSAGRSWNKMG